MRVAKQLRYGAPLVQTAIVPPAGVARPTPSTGGCAVGCCCYPRLMSSRFVSWKPVLSMAAVCLCSAASWAAPSVVDPELQVRNVMNTGSGSFRLVRNPDDKQLYYLKTDGRLYRVNLVAPPGQSTSSVAYSSTTHQITSAA